MFRLMVFVFLFFAPLMAYHFLHFQISPQGVGMLFAAVTSGFTSWAVADEERERLLYSVTLAWVAIMTVLFGKHSLGEEHVFSVLHAGEGMGRAVLQLVFGVPDTSIFFLLAACAYVAGIILWLQDTAGALKDRFAAAHS